MLGAFLTPYLKCRNYNHECAEKHVPDHDSETDQYWHKESMADIDLNLELFFFSF